jgi:ParB family chromosome partitioning protein
MPVVSPVSSSTNSKPASPAAAPKKNTQESASLAAKAALQRTAQLSLDSTSDSLPARQDGRVPLRNTYRIELEHIEPDPNQPRRHFDDDSLAELTASIKSRDIKQPLTVRWHPESRRFRIIDGERRFRAAKLADLQDVPCIVQQGDSKGVLIDQIVHNWQRTDLRPYETADALVRLKTEYGLSVNEIALTTGKSVGEVSKLIALVEHVDPQVQKRVRQLGDASFTKRHLYALTHLEPQQQMRLAKRIERQHLTVTETERLVKAGLDPARKKPLTPGRPRKHIRIKTDLGTIQLTPKNAEFDDHTLLAMLEQARHQLIDRETSH